MEIVHHRATPGSISPIPNSVHLEEEKPRVQRSLSKEDNEDCSQCYGIYTTSNLEDGPLEKLGRGGGNLELHFLGQCKNISGLLYVHRFSSFIFPL